MRSGFSGAQVNLDMLLPLQPCNTATTIVIHYYYCNCYLLLLNYNCYLLLLLALQGARGKLCPTEVEAYFRFPSAASAAPALSSSRPQQNALKPPNQVNQINKLSNHTNWMTQRETWQPKQQWNKKPRQLKHPNYTNEAKHNRFDLFLLQKGRLHKTQSRKLSVMGIQFRALMDVFCQKLNAKWHFSPKKNTIFCPFLKELFCSWQNLWKT